jgi:hypothetical protein
MARFVPLPAFPYFDRVYKSSELFPLFANRVMSPRRPDYKEFHQWLALPENEHDPMVVLARSGGQRVTDTLEIFRCPEQKSDGSYSLHFFAHGLRYMADDAVARAATLHHSEPLYVVLDVQNPADGDALLLRTCETVPTDVRLLGYWPRYLAREICPLLKQNGQAVRVKVERVNLPPVPIQYRLLCQATVTPPDGTTLFSSQMYQPYKQTPDIMLTVAQNVLQPA